MENKCKLVFEDGKCEDFDKNHGNKHVTTLHMSWLWHLRFGHLNFNSLKLYHEIVHDLPLIEDPKYVYEAYVLGEQARKKFDHGKGQSTSLPLQIVHTNLCGQMQTKSICMNSYFLIFINDFSRMCQVYFLKNKDKAFGYFKELKELIENESKHKIKCVRSDRGEEYDFVEFTNFCKENVIKRQYTTTYTPQQNGVAERKKQNSHRDGKMFNVIKKLHNMYWAQVVRTSNYILNRCSTSTIEGKTPFEA